MSIQQIKSGVIAPNAISADRLAAGVANTNIGYTPVNKAGDTMTGGLTLRGEGISSLLEPHYGYLIRSGSVNNVNEGGSGAASSWVEYQLGPEVYKTCFSVYFGPGPANSRSYWYWTRNTGVGTWMDFMKFEMWEGDWNWGQLAGYREFYVSSVANSWSVQMGDERNHTGFGAVSINVKVNGTTNVIIGGSNTGSANRLRYQVYSKSQLFTNNMSIVHSSSNPFA